MSNKVFEDFYEESKQYPKILRKYYERGKVFTDPTFHPNGNIAEEEIRFNEKDHKWERIDKYYNAPLFKREAIDENAIMQGELGDCYFIAALSRIARQPEIVELLFDKRSRKIQKEFSGGKKKKIEDLSESINLKCGAVVIYFHAFGRSTPVLIDTLIPFRRGTRKPRFCHPADIKYSPWFCLVEKAYAKLCGSYSKIIGGTLPSAIYSLFGYFPEHLYTNSVIIKRRKEKIVEQKIKEIKKSRENSDDSDDDEIDKDRMMREIQDPTIDTFKKGEIQYLFGLIMKYQHDNAVIGASINLNDISERTSESAKVSEDELRDSGLVRRHAYLIMKARREDGHNFICLRNPWGDHEWLGDWSDTSDLWTPELKRALGVHAKDDGTFWMVDKDFFRYFTCIQVATPINPEYHFKSCTTQLVPGPWDGRLPTDSEVHLEQRKCFVIHITDVSINPSIFSKNSKKGGKKSKKQFQGTIPEAEMHIRIDKRVDADVDTLPMFQIFICKSQGKKLTAETVNRSGWQCLSTRNNPIGFTFPIKDNNPIVIALQRIQKANFEEDCYIQFACKYDFDLYEITKPKKLMKEDEKYGIVFDNSSQRYKNIAKEICIKDIDGQELPAYPTLSTCDLDTKFYENLEINLTNSDYSDAYEFEYDLDEEPAHTAPKKSETDSKSLKKKKKQLDTIQKSIDKQRKEIAQMKKEIEEERMQLEEDKKEIKKMKSSLKKKLENDDDDSYGPTKKRSKKQARNSDSDSEPTPKKKSKRQMSDSDSDSEPVQKKSKKQASDSDSDSEPVQKKSKKYADYSDSDSEPTPKKKSKKQMSDSDSDSEPVQKKSKRQMSDSDSEPTPKKKSKKQVSDSDSESVQKKSKKYADDSDSDSDRAPKKKSKKQMSEYDSDSDYVPKKKSKKYASDSDSDYTPKKKTKKQMSDSDSYDQPKKKAVVDDSSYSDSYIVPKKKRSKHVSFEY